MTEGLLGSEKWSTPGWLVSSNRKHDIARHARTAPLVMSSWLMSAFRVRSLASSRRPAGVNRKEKPAFWELNGLRTLQYLPTCRSLALLDEDRP